MSLGDLLVVDGDGERFLRSDEDDEPFAASDARIKQVAVQHLVMRGMDGHDEAGAFAALVFVDGDGVGKQ